MHLLRVTLANHCPSAEAYVDEKVPVEKGQRVILQGLIGTDYSLHAKWRSVRGVAVAANDHDHPDEADPGRVWLETGVVRKGRSIEALSLAGAVPEEITVATRTLARVLA